LETVIEAIASIYEASAVVRGIILFIVGKLTAHFVIYTVMGFFITRKFKPTDKLHKYAIVIAARNEEKVIGNLLDSIKNQDYPSEYIDVFVVADNCTDKTAEIVREKGAVCYERFDSERRTKGFALQFLFENIKKDYGIEAYEGYFVFDADNLLSPDYVSRMNEAFDEGEKIITSYRNTKNFDENWIAFSYAIHWLRTIRIRHRARSVLRLATNIQGTGFLFANELVKDGWNYTSLTEDRAFTADAVAHGYPISYCDAAMFYDEQPTSLKVALRQRLRWSKGHLLAFVEIGPYLFKNIFVGNCYKDKTKKEPMTKKRFVEGIRQRFASYDVLVHCFPSAVVKVFLWLIVPIIIGACFSYTNGITDWVLLDPAKNILTRALSWIFGTNPINMTPGFTAMVTTVGVVVLWNLLSRINYHIKHMFMAAYVLFTERNRIIKMPLRKKILYSITWPVFDIIGRWTTYVALFKKVEWKPIPHTSKITIENIEKSSKKETVKKNNKKITTKILFLVLPFVFMDVTIRIMSLGINYFQWKAVIPSLLFSALWIAFVVCISTFLKGRIGQILYGVFFALFFTVYTTHLVYYPYTGFFFNFKLLGSVEEGAAYIWDTVKNSSLYSYVLFGIALVLGIVAVVKFPRSKKTNWKLILVSISSFMLLRFATPVLYGSANSALEWDTWRNPRNVYESFGDANKSIKICGLFEYTARDAWKTLTNEDNEIDAHEAEFLENSYSELTNHEKNDYTGIFEEKNLIILQLEGIDSWLFNENDMPNFTALTENSFVFDDHYSYYNGGGSTFNSEFAVSTGFLTPVSYSKNAYLFNNNSFPKTLPKLFKERGYVANAFHMNTGEYYMRELNYKNWGYDNYYSLIDDCKYNDGALYLDTELINNETFYSNMFLQDKPFLNYIITYTPHTPFSMDSKTGEALSQKLYGEEVNPEEYTEEDVARLYATETDDMIGLLMQALEDNGLSDNTVIVAFADHYLYTLNDKSILDKHKTTHNNLINHTPFLIWSKDIQGEVVEKTNSQLDILPTLLNLFGIEYQDGYYIGNDIFDPSYKGYAFFSDYSWYDGENYVELGAVAVDSEVDKAYIEAHNEVVNSLITRNDLTLKYDYFKKIKKD